MADSQTNELTKYKTHNCKPNTFYSSEVQYKKCVYRMYTYHRVKIKVQYAKIIYYHVYFIDITILDKDKRCKFLIFGIIKNIFKHFILFF